MKSKFSFLFICMLSLAFFANAQGGQRRSVEERVKDVMDKLAPLNLTKDQSDKTDSIFIQSYRAMAKMREGLPEGQRPDPADMQKVNDSRDTQLKAVFTPDQFKKYKDEIEPTLRPQRRNGPPAGGTN